MTIHIKKFKEINEGFYFSDEYDVDLLQEVIEGMRPNKISDGEEFKEKLKDFNKLYPCKEPKRLSEVLGKQVAWWVDLNLVQDVIDRMNHVLNKDADKYKKDLKIFLQ
jgi:hypothetical protein